MKLLPSTWFSCMMWQKFRSSYWNWTICIGCEGRRLQDGWMAAAGQSKSCPSGTTSIPRRPMVEQWIVRSLRRDEDALVFRRVSLRTGRDSEKAWWCLWHGVYSIFLSWLLKPQLTKPRRLGEIFSEDGEAKSESEGLHWDVAVSEWFLS